MIVSVRGTNGSGKSTLVRTLLDKYKGVPIYGLLGPRRPEAYKLEILGIQKPVYILGSYHVASGGCDQIQPYDLILDLLAKYAALGHVLFEGVIVSSSYGRVGRLMETFGKEAVMAFLDTSLEQCIANVQKRRDTKQDAREFDPANLTTKYNQIMKNKVKIAEEGKLRVEHITMKLGSAQVVGFLRGAK